MTIIEHRFKSYYVIIQMKFHLLISKLEIAECKEISPFQKA